MLRWSATLGLGSALLMLCGVDHIALLALLWLLYISFVHVGQIFYGYGWETLLLETGFLAIFWGTLRTWTSLRDARPRPRIMFVWLCWLLFRLMFGAGAIKLRGGATGSAPLRGNRSVSDTVLHPAKRNSTAFFAPLAADAPDSYSVHYPQAGATVSVVWD